MIIVSVYFLLEQLAEIGFEGALYILCATAFTQEIHETFRYVCSDKRTNTLR